MNNGNEYFIVGDVVCPEYSSNIQYLHLIIGNVRKFVSDD